VAATGPASTTGKGSGVRRKTIDKLLLVPSPLTVALPATLHTPVVGAKQVAEDIAASPQAPPLPAGGAGACFRSFHAMRDSSIMIDDFRREKIDSARSFQVPGGFIALGGPPSDDMRIICFFNGR